MLSLVCYSKIIKQQSLITQTSMIVFMSKENQRKRRIILDLENMRTDSAIKQKKGLHFILASIIIWSAVTIVHMTSLPILTKNLLTFCFTAPLLPLAYLISKAIKVDFTNKNNPLTQLGLLFSFNQMLYLLIAMWIYPTLPEKMIMVIAMIFGAHLLPYAWLYQSKSYMIMSISIPLVALFVGVSYSPTILGIVMIGMVILFSGMLILEVRNLPKIET